MFEDNNNLDFSGNENDFNLQRIMFKELAYLYPL